MDSNQDQGTEEPQGRPTSEVLESHRERETSLKERSKTALDRLDKYFADQGEQGTPGPQEEPRGKETKVDEPMREPKKDPKTPEPMPSSNQEPKPSIEEPKAEPTEETPQEKALAPETEDQLPDSANERTKRNFERMREARRQAEEEKLRLEQEVQRLKGSVNTGFGYPPQAFTPTAVPPINPNLNYLPPQQVAAIQNQFVQPDGSVDIDGLNKALYQSNLQAAQAIQQAQLARAELQQDRAERARFDEAQQLREAHTKFPDLDPESIDFDENFRDLVSVQVAKNKMQGVHKSLSEVAEEVHKRYKPSAPSEVKPAAQVEEQRTQKMAQAPLESAQGQAREESTMESLREQTRRGKLENSALDERLRKLGIIS